MKAVPIKRRWIERAKELHDRLIDCGDAEFWAWREGYTVTHADLPDTIPAVLLDGGIVVQHGRPEDLLILDVAHEICHREFHGRQIAFRDGANTLEENQADTFALFVYTGSVWNYNSLENFLLSTNLRPEFHQARIDLFDLINE